MLLYFVRMHDFQVREFGENVDIDGEHANIMNPKYDIFFFQSFNIVFNALDNVKARQYVNTMCVLADVPLIEGGSTGLLGQSYPIIPHYTECYNCRPRGGDEGEKYAVCTIRRQGCQTCIHSSTPDKIEHCIVWGKELYILLFGDRSSSLLYEEVDSVYMDSLEPHSEEEVKDREECLSFCIRLMDAVFDKEIDKRVKIGTYATSEQKPDRVGILEMVDRKGVLDGVYSKKSENYEEIWNTKDCVNILLSFLLEYFTTGKHVITSSLPYRQTSLHSFDKDNHGDMTIVTAATNISFESIICYDLYWIPALPLLSYTARNILCY